MPRLGQSKKRISLPPPDIAQRMTVYGEYEIASFRLGVGRLCRPRPLIHHPLHPIASATPQRFTEGSIAFATPFQQKPNGGRDP
jgi:hypothetical protein